LRASTLRVLTGSALTAGLLGVGATAAAADDVHEVQPGDTLADIASDRDAVESWRDLYEANQQKLDDPNLIFPGQQLRLTAESAPADPAPESYTVAAGDTLASIGELHGVSWQDLHAFNRDQISDPSLIFPGQELSLVGPAPASASTDSAPAESSSSESAPAESTSSADDSSTESTASESTSSASTDEGSSTSSSSLQPQGTVSIDTWNALAQCESSGDWHINTGNGYYGGLQFALSSWEWVGGTGYPHEASKEEQIARAELLLDRQGWEAWPACSKQLGLR
jgi:LysM repeat protein